MAYYCAVHQRMFEKKSVVELGGGSTCLAGVMLAMTLKPSRVLLSDGNQKCVETLEEIAVVCRKHGGENVCVSLIRWDIPDRYNDRADSFDFVICADCLFFDEGRPHLVTVIHTILKLGGKALVFAPRRGKTLDQFLELCSVRFSRATLFESYCPLLSEKHENLMKTNKLYKPDLHYPLLIELIKWNSWRILYASAHFIDRK